MVYIESRVEERKNSNHQHSVTPAPAGIDCALPQNAATNLSEIVFVTECSDLILEHGWRGIIRHVPSAQVQKVHFATGFLGVTRWISYILALGCSIHFFGGCQERWSSRHWRLCEEKKKKNQSRYPIKMDQRYLLQTRLIMIKIHIKHTPLASCQNRLMERKDERERERVERERGEREKDFKKTKVVYKY